MPLDLTDESSFEAVSVALEQTPGAEVSLLVNNAGFGTFGDFAQQPADDAPRMVALLLRAPVELTYRALPYMAAGSRIINVASVAAFIPQPRLSVYSAAKRFVLDFSRSLDVELGEVGIHVTALCPEVHEDRVPRRPGRRGRRGEDDPHRLRARRRRRARRARSGARRAQPVHPLAGHEGALRDLARGALQARGGHRAGARDI